MGRVVTSLCVCLISISMVPASEAAITECETTPKDIVFLLDSSGSVGQTSFQKMLNFTKAVVSNFAIGPRNTQVGIETFSSILHHQFAMNVNKNLRSLLTAIDKIPYQSGGTYIGLALEYATKHSFHAGGRQGADKILILITDGRSTSPNATAVQVKLLHRANISVFCVGVGKFVDKTELQQIANKASRTLFIQNFDFISKIIRKLYTTICKDLNQTTVTTIKSTTATKRTTRSTNPTTRSTKPTMRSTKPTTRSTKTTTRSTKPTTRWTKPTTRWTKPTTRSTKPTTKTSRAAVQTRISTITTSTTSDTVSSGKEAIVHLQDLVHGIEYIEMAVLTIVSVVTLGFITCCCRSCFLFAKRREDEEEQPKRKQPCKRPKRWPSY